MNKKKKSTGGRRHRSSRHRGDVRECSRKGLERELEEDSRLQQRLAFSRWWTRSNPETPERLAGLEREQVLEKVTPIWKCDAFVSSVERFNELANG